MMGEMAKESEFYSQQGQKLFLHCVQRDSWCPIRSRIQLIAWGNAAET